MSHEIAFADAVRPAKVTVLRLPMRDYSIGHELILISESNALFCEPEEFAKLSPIHQRQAIIRAALVCHRTWEENQKAKRWPLFWGWVIKKADFALEIAEFRNYRLAGSTMPPQPTKDANDICNKPEEAPARSLGGCHMARLIHFVVPLCERMGVGCVYDFPFGLANHLYLTQCELDGGLKIENAKEAQVREEIESHKAAFAKEKEKP